MAPVGRGLVLVVVCTANVARSPLVAALLAEGLGAGAQVRSAGTHARDGEPAAPDTVRVAAARGLDLAGHRSARLCAADVDAADLVLTMEHRHSAHAAHLAPGSATRVMSLPAAAELLGQLPERPSPDGVVGLGTWVASRRARSVLTSAEVADPYGAGAAAFDDMAAEVHAMTTDVVRGLRRWAA